MIDPKIIVTKPEEKKNFRQYDTAPDHVKEFYKRNHTYQTYDYVVSKKKEIFPFSGKHKYSFKELNEIITNTIDDSDPDFVNGRQIYHALFTGEACRVLFPNDDWMHLTGFLHDYGKILMNPKLYDLPSWAVVGDIFPVGCKFSDKIVYPEYFKENPDCKNELYNSELGIYKKNCGFDNVQFSFSHDEYLYQVLKANAKGKVPYPEDGMYLIRYHSFYPWHREQAYSYLASQRDVDMLPKQQLFSTADLYTKMRNCDKEELIKILPYYESLFEKYVAPIDEPLNL